MTEIALRDLTFGYPGQPCMFSHLTCTIRQQQSGTGYISVVMGPSGAGKSTLLKLLLGMLKPQSGTVAIGKDGGPVTVSYVPQEPVLFEHLTPLQNARYFATTARYRRQFDETRFEAVARALEMNEVLATTRSVEELSGGQRQRLMLLRSLSINPGILLLDEPTNGLDPGVKAAFLRTLQEIVHQFGLLAVYVTHHRAEAEWIADEILYLDPAPVKGEPIRLFQQPLGAFMQAPPVLSAAQAFHYPSGVVLPVKALPQSGTQPVWAHTTADATYFLVAGPMHWSSAPEGQGTPARILTRHTQYLTVTLGDTPHVVLLDARQEWPEPLCLQLLDGWLAYDREGVLVG